MQRTLKEVHPMVVEEMRGLESLPSRRGKFV